MATVLECRVISNFPNLVVNAGFGRTYSFKTDNHYPKDKPVKLLIQNSGKAELFDVEHDACIKHQEEAKPDKSMHKIDLDCVE